MKTFSCFIVCLFILLALPVCGSSEIIFYDDLEDNIDNWTPFGAGLEWSSENSYSGSKSFKSVEFGRMEHILDDWRIEVGMYIQFMFYDPNGPADVNNYVHIHGFENPYAKQNRQTFLGIGCRSIANNAYYNAWTNDGWSDLSVPRSVGWHKMRMQVVGGDGSGGTGRGLVNFYVNDVLGAENVPFNWAPLNLLAVGSGLSSTDPGYYYFDDIEVGVVPEPGSLFALGLGITGIAGMLRKSKSSK